MTKATVCIFIEAVCDSLQTMARSGLKGMLGRVETTKQGPWFRGGHVPMGFLDNGLKWALKNYFPL